MAEDSRIHLPTGTKTKQHFICSASADLMTDTGMGTQALFGQRFDVIHVKAGVAYGVLYSILPSSARIDYIGNLPEQALSDAPHKPTYRVTVIAAAVFESADIKSKLLNSVPRNASLSGTVDGDFLHLVQGGYVHLRHLSPVNGNASRTYMALAEDMLGLPYIWGGTGHIGVDCSGLVQSALAANGVDAPRDADQQEAVLGDLIRFEDRQSGDLLFWSGHVGIVVERDQLLHANAHHMCVALEPVTTAVERIGEVRTTKRFSVV